MKTKFLLLFIIFGFLSAEAQVSLPYLTGFDNTSDQSGWVEYKKGSTQYSHWGFNTFSAFSAPKCLSHDYSPSTGITLTDNWYVSPGFNIPSGGKLDSLRYMFNGFSVPDNTDTIAVYLLTGSQNPSLASQVTLLFDFRNNEYTNDYAYHLLNPIDLIGSNDVQYIAIRYRNTDCSSKWLSVNFDNLSVSSNSQNGFESPSLLPNFQIYPNPIKDFINIKSDQPMEYIRIINLLGKEVLHSEHNLQSEISTIDLTSFSNGVYFIQISCNHQLFTKKIIIQSL